LNGGALAIQISLVEEETQCTPQQNTQNVLHTYELKKRTGVWLGGGLVVGIENKLAKEKKTQDSDHAPR